VKRKVPLLGDIPLVGLLFTSIEKSITQTELVAFITPRVIDNTADLPAFNQPFNDRLNQLRERLGKDAPPPVEPGQVAPGPVDDTPGPTDDPTPPPPANPTK